MIIDNDRASRRLLRTLLEPERYRVIEAENIATGLDRLAEREPEVIILEMKLPDGDGLSTLRSLREWSRTPVLMLSEECTDEVKVAALDGGASDFLTKPFSGTELLARLRVLQRAFPNVPDGPLLVERELVANLITHEISLRGNPIELTRKEEALFFVLARHAGKVVTRSHLFRSIWGMHSEQIPHHLHVLVANVRKKLEPYGGELLIRTEGNIGYRLILSAQPEALQIVG